MLESKSYFFTGLSALNTTILITNIFRFENASTMCTKRCEHYLLISAGINFRSLRQSRKTHDCNYHSKIPLTKKIVRYSNWKYGKYITNSGNTIKAINRNNVITCARLSCASRDKTSAIIVVSLIILKHVI